MTSVNFERPPVVEVVLGIEFDPVDGLASYRSGELFQKWRLSYPHVSQQEELPPPPPLDAEDGSVFLRVGGATGSRLWFTSQDSSSLIQLQSDRLIVNWRRMSNTRYPRYEAVRDRFIAALEDLKQTVDTVQPLTVRQVEVTYVNIEGESPALVLSGWNNPVCSQRHGRFNAAFEESLALANATRARRLTTINGVYGTQPQTQLNLSVHAEPSDTTNPLPMMDEARLHIISRFKEITDSSMHEKWGVLQ